MIHVVQRARAIFGLDFDLDAAHERLGTDATIGPMVRTAPGLRPPGAWDPFETAIRTICGQMVSVTSAGAIVARIVDRHGMPVPGLGGLGLSQTFPTPAILAEGDLDGLGLTATRVRAVRTLARSVADGSLRLDRGDPLERFVESACSLPGLGPWSAHYLAMRVGHADAFPASDLGLRRSLAELTGRSISARDAELFSQPWRPWRSLAATHLWFRLGSPTKAGSARPPVDLGRRPNDAIGQGRAGSGRTTHPVRPPRLRRAGIGGGPTGVAEEGA